MKKKYSLHNIFCFLKGAFYFGFKTRVYVRGSLFLDKRIEINISKGLRLYGFLKKVSFFGHGKLILGKNVFINGGTIFECRSIISIGDSVKIGYNCLIIDAENHSIDGFENPINRPIVIEDNCWIAANVTILPGVTIGKNTIIAAGSIVNKNVLPNSIYGGVPARFIKKIDYNSKKFRD
jgi:maltose O-acetyltransferase